MIHTKALLSADGAQAHAAACRNLCSRLPHNPRQSQSHRRPEIFFRLICSKHAKKELEKTSCTPNERRSTRPPSFQSMRHWPAASAHAYAHANSKCCRVEMPGRIRPEESGTPPWTEESGPENVQKKARNPADSSLAGRRVPRRPLGSLTWQAGTFPPQKSRCLRTEVPRKICVLHVFPRSAPANFPPAGAIRQLKERSLESPGWCSTPVGLRN